MVKKRFSILIFLSITMAINANELNHTNDTNASTHNDEWVIDRNQTIKEGAKLGTMTLVPISILIGSIFVLEEQKSTLYLASAITAIPALVGITLFTIEIVSYNNDKKSAETTDEEKEEKEIKISYNYRF